MKLYYDFLSSLRSLPQTVHVVITAGNHDAARNLAAPKEPLRWVNATVIGQLSADPESWEQALLSFEARDASHPGLVVAAVPFVQAYHLGSVPQGMEGQAESQERAEHAIGGCYKRLAEVAGERFPGRPRIAMGHLTVGKPAPEDKQLRRIHSWDGVGGLQGLSTDIFGTGYCYVALGHIHRAYAVSSAPPVRYAGSPVALDHQEAGRPHSVTLLEVEPDGTVRHELVEVPQARALLTLNGRTAELCAQIANLQPTLLPTLLDILQTVEQHELHGDSAIDAAIAALPEPRPIKLRHHKLLQGTDGGPDPIDLPPLEAVTPEELFARMFRAKHKESPADHLLELFRTISAGEKGSR
jgi:exonuclease SbcD